MKLSCSGMQKFHVMLLFDLFSRTEITQWIKARGESLEKSGKMYEIKMLVVSVMGERCRVVWISSRGSPVVWEQHSFLRKRAKKWTKGQETYRKSKMYGCCWNMGWVQSMASLLLLVNALSPAPSWLAVGSRAWKLGLLQLQWGASNPNLSPLLLKIRI